MAYQESLIQWTSRNRNLVSLAAKEFDWFWRNGFPLYDFEVRLSIDGFSGLGRGTDHLEERALEKAIAEALERAVCASLGFSTVGVAAHTSLELAEENAYREALERFVFESHLRDKRPFDIITTPQADYLVSGMQFFRMRASPSVHAFVCFLDEEGTRFLGLSCEREESAAFEKSALEVLRNFSAFQDDKSKFRQEVEKNANLWNCRPDFLSQVESLFSKGSDDVDNVNDLPIPEFQKMVLRVDHLESLKGCPIFFSKFEPVRGPR